MIRRIGTMGAVAALALAGITAAVAAPAEKVTICHHTASETNPVVVITISGMAVGKHKDNHGHTGPDQDYVDGVCGDPGAGEF